MTGAERSDAHHADPRANPETQTNIGDEIKMTNLGQLSQQGQGQEQEQDEGGSLQHGSGTGNDGVSNNGIGSATQSTDTSGAGQLSSAQDSSQPSAPSIKGKQAASTADADNDAIQSAAKTEGPVCMITLLLTSGARHPYKIDEKYLTKRNVDVPTLPDSDKKDPFGISVYTLKELILREWRDDWDAKPASPSSIRLIHFGKLLNDKEQLKQYHFSAEAPNVVHMSVRPQDIIDEEEAKAASKAASNRQNQDQDRRCCVIL